MGLAQKNFMAMMGRIQSAILLTALLVGPLMAPIELHAQSADGSSIVYLVRHAEKATDGDLSDPLLSAPGVVRANLVADMLVDIPLTTVYSTSFFRTVDTASPTAGMHGLPITDYDPRSRGAMAELVVTLRTTPGHHLVVGHSNTTPDLVEALGGDQVSAIDEAEYDRLYIVVIGPDGSVSSSMLRFGALWDGVPADAGH